MISTSIICFDIHHLRRGKLVYKVNKKRIFPAVGHVQNHSCQVICNDNVLIIMFQPLHSQNFKMRVSTLCESTIKLVCQFPAEKCPTLSLIKTMYFAFPEL